MRSCRSPHVPPLTRYSDDDYLDFGDPIMDSLEGSACLGDKVDSQTSAAGADQRDEQTNNHAHSRNDQVWKPHERFDHPPPTLGAAVGLVFLSVLTGVIF